MLTRGFKVKSTPPLSRDLNQRYSQGSSALACITPVTEETVVFPLTQMPILRDLVVDFRWFFKQVELVQNSTPKPNKVCSP